MGLFKQGRRNADMSVHDGSVDGQPPRGSGPGQETELEILSRERIQLLRERDELVVERDRLRSKLTAAVEESRRLEVELARQRARVEPTSKLFLHASDYSISIRADARRDAELTLRKAKARADAILGNVVHERERTERELLRLHALASETRAKLQELTTESLSLLTPLDATGSAQGPNDGSEDLEDTLRAALATSTTQGPQAHDVEGQDERRP